MSEAIDLTKEFQNFDWKKLSKVRGKAHEGIIGEWISWWIEIDSQNHMVFNPAPYAENRSADIVFLRNVKGYYFPFGVAEVENNPKKWMEKLNTLTVYEKQYSKLETLGFLLLCVTTRSADEEKFRKLVQQAMNISKDSELNWILYRLTKIPWKKDTCPIVRENEMVWFYESIVNGESFVIKSGKVKA